MANPKPWQKAMQIRDEDWSAWSEQIPKGESALFWLLKHGKIKIEEYFEWARNHFEIVSLNVDFFKQPLDQKFWQNMQNVSNWSPQMLPLLEWDGVIFIGCVEPDLEVKWSFPVTFVLVSPQDLESQWKKYQNQSLSANETVLVVTPSAAPIAVSATTPNFVLKAEPNPETSPSFELKPSSDNLVAAPSAKPAPAPNSSPNFSPTPPPAATPVVKPSASAAPATPIILAPPVSMPPPAPAVAAFDAPAGINFNLISEVVPTQPTTAVADEPAAPAFEMPEGINLNLAPSIAPPTMPQAAPKVAPTLSQAPPASPASTAPPPLKTAAPVAQTTTSTTSHAASVPTAPAAASIAMDTAPVDLSKNEKYHNSQLDGEFQELQKSFHANMILSIEEQNIKTWFHDGNWNPRSNDAFASIDISKPSIFRIVQKSGQPYHGSISSNPINDHFFRIWGFTTNPEHITVVPIKYDLLIVGLLVCIGTKAANTLQVLRNTEKMLERIKPILEKIQKVA